MTPSDAIRAKVFGDAGAAIVVEHDGLSPSFSGRDIGVLQSETPTVTP
jgi:hypothetical protein